MKFIILGQMEDYQTGHYIFDAIRQIGHHSASIDIRKIYNLLGRDKAQERILFELKRFKDEAPDVIIVLKGLELTQDTITKIRQLFPDTKIVNWFFDINYSDRYIADYPGIKDIVEQYDYFFCSLEGVAFALKELGLDNVYHLAEACHPPAHNPPKYANRFQKRKYGEDVSFCGSLGYLKIHPNRLKILKHVVNEGFRINIWGKIISHYKYIPKELYPFLKKEEVINEKHSLVAHYSLVNLGLDAKPTLYGSWSARLYRVLCAEGLYLSTNTYGLEDYFNINKEGDPITGNEDLVVFYSLDDLTGKLDFLLEHNDIRTQIAKNGRQKVLNEHTFNHRIEEMIEIMELKGDKNEK